MRKVFALTTLFALSWILPATNITAVSFNTIYDFSPDAFQDGPNPQATNFDGVSPDSLIVSGNTVYGVCIGGGVNGYGTIFRVDLDGLNFTNFHDFNMGPYNVANNTYPESTGANPNAGLLLVSNTLYGTTFYGGKFDAGTVFKINTDGTGFSLIYSLDFTNGQSPSCGLTRYGDKLYGTAAGGGTNSSGTIFGVDLQTQQFFHVVDFTNQEHPYGAVVVVSNVIYGFGRYGGTSSNGVVYSAGGGGYSILYNFDGSTGSQSYGGPTLSGNTMYGVTYAGGTNGAGNIFRIDINGQNYTNLFSFQGQGGANTTGAYPYDFAGLVLSGNVLYGSASVSGFNGQGTVFQINTDGGGFKVLHSFGYSDGSQPGQMVLVGGTLYGVATYGVTGISLGDGALFSLTLQPTLKIALNGGQVVLTWNDPSYSLYSGSSITNISTQVFGALNSYTTPVSGAQQFFQLKPN